MQDSIHSGAYQIASAMDSLEAGLTQTRELAKAGVKDPELKAALVDADDLIDGAGANLGDYGTEPKSPDFAARDEWRLKAIEAANDARHDLSDAEGAIDDFLEGATEVVGRAIDDIEADLDDAIDALTSAIEALGGKAEPLDDGSTAGVPDPTASK